MFTFCFIVGWIVGGIITKIRPRIRLEPRGLYFYIADGSGTCITNKIKS